MTALEVVDLSFARPTFRLGPLDLTVPRGGRLAVVGPSGAGKTTLLRCLCGFERPQRGTIRIGGTVVHEGRRSLPPDRRGLGVVYQDGALWPHLTVLQHLRFAAPDLSRAAALELLDRAGLLPLAGRRPRSLSGGEAQRLGLVRALAAGPRLLLLDEPLRSIDVHRRDDLVLLVRRVADERGLATVVVTHDRDEALALATDVVVLREGRIVERGPALELLRAPATAFTAAFLGGAACLPTQRLDGGRLATPFGELPWSRPAAEPPQLVLMPGDVAARAATAGRGDLPHGSVLASVPGDGFVTVRVALGDRIVTARAGAPLPVGSDAELSLLRPARLLPAGDGGPA